MNVGFEYVQEAAPMPVADLDETDLKTITKPNCLLRMLPYIFMVITTTTRIEKVTKYVSKLD